MEHYYKALYSTVAPYPSGKCVTSGNLRIPEIALNALHRVQGKIIFDQLFKALSAAGKIKF